MGCRYWSKSLSPTAYLFKCVLLMQHKYFVMTINFPKVCLYLKHYILSSSIYMYIHICIYIYTYMYVYIYTCMYMCVLHNLENMYCVKIALCNFGISKVCANLEIA